MIVIASDHAGVDLKARIVELIGEAGHDVRDLGPAETTSVDYPDFAHAVAETDDIPLHNGITGICNCNPRSAALHDIPFNQGIQVVTSRSSTAQENATGVLRVDGIRPDYNVVCALHQYALEKHTRVFPGSNLPDPGVFDKPAA